MKKESSDYGHPDGNSPEKKELSFESHVAIYCRQLYRFLYGLCHDEDLSKDLLQDTMIAAQCHLKNGFYTEQGLIWCWLKTIAQNALFKHIRLVNRHRSKFSSERQLIFENLGWENTFVEPDTLAGEEDKDSPQRIRQRRNESLALLIQTKFRLLNLSQEERKLVAARHLQMKSFKEIACMSDKAISTVMSRYYTVIKKIQCQLLDWEKQGLLLQEIDLQVMKKIHKAKLRTERSKIKRPKR